RKGRYVSWASSGLTRHEISDGWRERAWLQARGCSYHKLDIGAASRSLHRMVRRHCGGDNESGAPRTALLQPVSLAAKAHLFEEREIRSVKWFRQNVLHE